LINVISILQPAQSTIFRASNSNSPSHPVLPFTLLVRLLYKYAVHKST